MNRPTTKKINNLAIYILMNIYVCVCALLCPSCWCDVTEEYFPRFHRFDKWQRHGSNKRLNPHQLMMLEEKQEKQMNSRLHQLWSDELLSSSMHLDELSS